MNLTNAAERLVIAADFQPDSSGIKGVYAKVIALAKELRETGVTIKLNSVLRACGYDIIDELHALGLKVCADLKLNDIPATMKTDGQLLAEVAPEYLTVMASAGAEGMKAVRGMLPAEIWAVTVLTSFDGEMCKRVYGTNNINEVVLRLAHEANDAGVAGLVCSPKEVSLIRLDRQLDCLTLNTPGIRYPWSETGDQKRFLTAGEAIKNGARHVIVGRPILNACPNNEDRPQSPKEAMGLILRDIADAIGG